MKLRSPVVGFGLASIVVFAAVLGLGGLVHDTQSAMVQGTAGLVFVLSASAALWAMARGYAHPVTGLCNMVTLMRLGLACVLVGALAAPGWSAWPVFAVAALAFSLDGLDGFLARRAQLTSDFGARFDMEVDCLLALSLAVLAYQSGAAGPYVLLLGLPRYAFGLAQLVLPWMNAALPPRFSRKVVCVVQIAALLLMVFPPIGSPLTDIVAAVASLALAWSFLLDIVWLRRQDAA